MTDSQIILNVVILFVLILTLMMAWASHRKLKTHQYYLQALIEHEILEDMEREMMTPPTVVAPAATLMPATKMMKGSTGEMCNDLRSPMGKIYNRDCLKSAITGSASMHGSSAGVPNINSMIQKKYETSG